MNLIWTGVRNIIQLVNILRERAGRLGGYLAALEFSINQIGEKL
jgi:hypothetical protein